MSTYKPRQALALNGRLSPRAPAGHTMEGSQLAIPGVPGGAVANLETEAARIVAEDVAKRACSANAGASGHIVIDGGHLSGFVRDSHTTVRFAGGSVVVTTHD